MINRSDLMEDIRTKRDLNHWAWKDCKKDTWVNLKDYYMVTDKIWNKYGLGKKRGMFCIDCLEQRLGHKLGTDEITFCPLNLDNPYTFKIIKKSYNKVKK